MRLLDCKKLRDEAFWNPNNYDLIFDNNEIPSNIQAENSVSLEKRLQKLMPLGKIIHVDNVSASTPANNSLNIIGELEYRDKNGNLITRVGFK